MPKDSRYPDPASIPSIEGIGSSENRIVLPQAENRNVVEVKIGSGVKTRVIKSGLAGRPKSTAPAAILLTGATGTVGSYLAPILKEMGHKLICLVRPKDGQDSKERLAGILLSRSETVLTGDIISPGLGTASFDRRRWRGRIDKIIHCASSIKFDEALAEETTLVNVTGIKNVLDFAREIEIPEVHHISTAYVAGDAESFSESDLDVGQNCRNVYERTKLEAEKLVKGWKYGNHSIYRLGIVVGDTVTGYTPSFNGFYVFASRYWQFKQVFASKHADSQKYKANGIGFNPNGMLRLPIWGNFSPDSALSIIPINWVARMLTMLVEIPACGKVFHVVHPNPPKVRWLNDISLRHLGITDFRYGDSPDCDPRSLLGKFQRIFNRGTMQYLPYITHEARFEVSNMPRALGRNYLPPPAVDESFVARLLDYAKSVNFGKTQ